MSFQTLQNEPEVRTNKCALGKAGMGSFPQGVYFIRHSGLEPVSHTLGTIINYSDCSGG